MRRLLVTALVALVWVASVSRFFSEDPHALVTPLTERLRTASRHELRASNPEWDLMARTFTVLAFVNQARARPELLETVDEVLAETLAMDEAAGDAFVLPYFHAGAFADPKTRSVFVDGELALMLASRALARPDGKWNDELRVRIDRATAAMERGPVLSAESYPDEAWTFCNSIALAATTLSDRVDGRDHSGLRARWVTMAKQRLVEPRSGLLISSFTWQGVPRDGPEGSTLYLAAHMLQLVDAEFARDQWQRARRELMGERFGFAWSAEWPASLRGPDDVDSGPTVPLLHANAGASGLALVGAAAFGDEALLRELVASLKFGAFPVEKNGALHFAAGNTLADAVLLYSLTLEGA